MANIKIALTNLGKYNEGILDYVWLELPATDEEIADAYDKIEVCHDDKEYFDEVGNPYEEVFITDYESDVPGLEIGEYSNIDDLNEMASTIASFDEYDMEIFSAAMEAGMVDNIEDFDRDDYYFYPDVSTDSDLAYEYIEQVYGDVENMDKETIENYFDYGALGRDIRIEFSPLDWLDVDEDDKEAVKEICDEYGVESIDDIDAYTYFGASSEYEIGTEWVDQVGSIADAVKDPELYFDYDAFGRDLAMDGGCFVSNGFIQDCR